MKPSLLDRLVAPSTREFFREGRRLPGYSLFDWLHGYFYGRWPYFYIGVGTGEHRLSKALAPLVGLFSKILLQNSGADEAGHPAKDSGRAFADTYHGKVMPLDQASRLVMVNENIRLPGLEKIIPYSRATDLVLRNPDHIAVIQCPCRTSRKDPCLPLEVCIIVGEPFASFVLEHHPQRSRRISPQEAVEILQREDERGHVHHAFFKDAMLDRFYAICNCCACCCGAMQAHQNGVPMLAPSGYISQVDTSLCIGCGECNPFCQFDALHLVEDHSQVDGEKCMGCGVCITKCEQGALSLIREPQKGEPLEIVNLLQDFSPGETM
jgi:ferredoxin